MSDTPPTAAEAPAGAIDPAKTYRVTLARAVKYGPTWLRPNMAITVSAETLAELGDAVTSYEEASG